VYEALKPPVSVAGNTVLAVSEKIIAKNETRLKSSFWLAITELIYDSHRYDKRER